MTPANGRKDLRHDRKYDQSGGSDPAATDIMLRQFVQAGNASEACFAKTFLSTHARIAEARLLAPFYPPNAQMCPSHEHDACTCLTVTRLSPKGPACKPHAATRPSSFRVCAAHRVPRVCSTRWHRLWQRRPWCPCQTRGLLRSCRQPPSAPSPRPARPYPRSQH